MVAAAHPLAVEAGTADAASGRHRRRRGIAVQMVLGVVEPHASGIGGGGFLLHYDGTSHAISVYDGRETAPAGASPTMFMAPDGKPLGYREAVVSGMSVGVPGVVAMLELAHKEKGKLPWSDLFAPGRYGPRRLCGLVPPRGLAAADSALREEQTIREILFQPRRHAAQAGRAHRQSGSGRGRWT